MSEFQIIKRVNHEIEPLDVRYGASGVLETSIFAHRLTIEIHSSDRAIDCNLLAHQLAQYVKLTRIE